MSEVLSAALITAGDPASLTGGHLYNRHLVDRAGQHAARLSLHPLAGSPVLAGLQIPAARHRTAGCDVLVVDSIVAWSLAPWPAHVPLVAMLHQRPGGASGNSLSRSLRERLDRLTYRRADLLIVVSEWLRDTLVGSGFPPAKIRIVPPGRDVRRPIGRIDLRRGRKAALLTIANWVPNKGILDLLAAFQRLPQNLATLHLAGDESLDRAYVRRVRRLLEQPELRDRVVVHGAIPPNQIGALFAGADIFALPSRDEAYGTVFGEALAAGLPIVALRDANIPYLVTDRVEGLLTPPGRVDALAAALRRLAEDEGLRDRMSRAATQKALSLPTWDETAALFFRALRELVG